MSEQIKDDDMMGMRNPMKSIAAVEAATSLITTELHKSVTREMRLRGKLAEISERSDCDPKISEDIKRFLKKDLNNEH